LFIIHLLIWNTLKKQAKHSIRGIEKPKTPLECCQTLPMVSFVEKKRGSCKKARQREGKVFSSAAFS